MSSLACFADLRLAINLLRRDARAGELRLLLAALLVAVAAVTAVGFFTSRVERALALEAHQLLGADLRLRADQPWPQAAQQAAVDLGLRLAQTQTFPSMVMHQGRPQLVAIKAVSAAYPLRGALRTAPAPGAADAPASGVPAPGTVWIDDRAALTLQAGVGDRLAVGQLQLQVAAILTQEPDRSMNLFALAPRVLMHWDDVAASGLVRPGSRVSHRLLVAGPAAAVARYRSWAEARLQQGEQIEDASDARPEIRLVLDRAQRFLRLAALLAVILAAVAVALAARRYLQRHLDACAVMRCLGAPQGQLLRLFLWQFALLGGLAGLLGSVIGYGGHFVLHAWLASLLAAPLPAPSLLPALQGALVGGVLLFGFALPPLLQLKAVPTLRVLRRELGPPAGGALWAMVLGAAALASLMLWMAGEWRLGAYLVGGFALALAVFAVASRAMVALLARALGLRGGFGWRQGVANLERRGAASTLQVVALALGLMALLFLTVLRSELLDTWSRAAPADAPNRFVINIQPDQIGALAQKLTEVGVLAEFSPMIRGRLSAVNALPVHPETYLDERARRLVEREFNLSWQAELPAGNRNAAGRWFTAADAGQPLASVEVGLAQTLGLQVGDRLQYTIAGESLELTIVGLRQLNWDSRRVNFFVLTPPGVLENFPASHITSFYLPPDRAAVVTELVADFPNLTVIDVAALVAQLRGVLDQVARAVEFVFLFTLLAGVVVLLGALLAVFDERRHELAVLRALGATRSQLRGMLLAEFFAVGACAGLVGALGALALGLVVARQVLQLELPWSLPLWLYLPLFSALGGSLLVAGVGWWTTRRLLSSSPLAVLRAG